MSPAIAIDLSESDFFLRCNKPSCPTFVDTYIPTDYQEMMHRDDARQILAAGGFGSGKTLWDIKDSQKHMLITPKGRSLFGAPTYPQLNGTLKKDFEGDFPKELVNHISRKDNEITLANHHEIIYRSFDDPHKLRSLNLSGFSIVEASGAKYSVFSQLQNRLRNTAAVLFERDEHGDIVYNQKGRPEIQVDWRKGRSESNPDPGWVKQEFLERSGRVYLYGDRIQNEQYDFDNVNPTFSTHVVSTSANPYLPPDYESEQSVGKPDWWVRRFFGGSFRYAEGMVYPTFLDNVIDPVPIPKHWKRIIAMDYGMNDNTHFLFGALDYENKKVHIYDELVMSDANVKTISAEYKKKLKSIPRGAFLTTPVMDQRSMSKRQSHDEKKTLGTLFEDEGLLFEPAQMSLDARILRTSTLLENFQLLIHKTCKGLINELKDYKFPERTLDKPYKDVSKPEDKNNHGANALEFLCMELPANIEKIDLNAYTRSGRTIQAAMNADYYKIDRPEQYNPFKSGLLEKEDAYSIHYGGDIDGYDDINNAVDLLDGPDFGSDFD